MFRSIHPFDQSVVAEFELMSARDVENKLAKAAHAFASWKRTSFAHRSELMLKAAALLRQNKDEYARVITLEMGKITSEALAEIEKSAGACEFFALQAERLLADQPIRNRIAQEPCSLPAHGCHTGHYAVEFSFLAGDTALLRPRLWPAT